MVSSTRKTRAKTSPSRAIRSGWGGDEQLRNLLNARPLKAFIAPFAEADKRLLLPSMRRLSIVSSGSLWMPRRALAPGPATENTSSCTPACARGLRRYFQRRFNDLFASNSDTVSALTAMNTGFRASMALEHLRSRLYDSNDGATVRRGPKTIQQAIRAITPHRCFPFICAPVEQSAAPIGAALSSRSGPRPAAGISRP